MYIETELSYFFEFIGTEDEEYNASHKVWGVVEEENVFDEEDVVDIAKVAFVTDLAATTRKRDAVVAFF